MFYSPAQPLKSISQKSFPVTVSALHQNSYRSRKTGGSQREVNIDHSPAAPRRATNSATVMLNGQPAALGISPRSMRRSVFQCEMPANTVATTSPEGQELAKVDSRMMNFGGLRRLGVLV
jgi:hypothetical protein